MEQWEIYERISDHRNHQKRKWGNLTDKNQAIEGFILAIEDQLNKAKSAWMKGDIETVSDRMLKIASSAVASLEQYNLRETWIE